eukprot:22125-Pelagococcus_subviridis.AAC.1
MNLPVRNRTSSISRSVPPLAWRLDDFRDVVRRARGRRAHNTPRAGTAVAQGRRHRARPRERPRVVVAARALAPPLPRRSSGDADVAHILRIGRAATLRRRLAD